MKIKQDSMIPVGYVPSTCQSYVFQWKPLGRGVGPQVNKFEQISSDGHQMSPDPLFAPCGQTHACENISLAKLRLRVVKTSS